MQQGQTIWLVEVRGDLGETALKHWSHQIIEKVKLFSTGLEIG